MKLLIPLSLLLVILSCNKDDQLRTLRGDWDLVYYYHSYSINTVDFIVDESYPEDGEVNWQINKSEIFDLVNNKTYSFEISGDTIYSFDNESNYQKNYRITSLTKDSLKLYQINPYYPKTLYFKRL
jgi:hypothetical protein